MGRSLSLDKIPSETRSSFFELLADRPGLTLDDHVKWFSEQGYQVSRSAVHRYISAHIEAATDVDLPPAEAMDRSIRLHCLIIASRYAHPDDRADLIKIADELAAWVNASS